MHDLSDADIERLVRRALDGEGALDDLVNAAIFGAHVPQQWGDWSGDARRSWERAMRRMDEFQESIRTDAGAAQRANWGSPPTIEDAWNAVESLAPDPVRWWRLPGVTWTDFGPLLRAPVRTINYQLCDVQGWRFAGLGSKRRVTTAPCAVCHSPRPVSDIQDRACPDCRP